jgi:hypothetical protein
LDALDNHVEGNTPSEIVNAVQVLFVSLVNMPDMLHVSQYNHYLTTDLPIEDVVRAWPEFQLMETILPSRG